MPIAKLMCALRCSNERVVLCNAPLKIALHHENPISRSLAENTHNQLHQISQAYLILDNHEILVLAFTGAKRSIAQVYGGATRKKQVGV